MTQRAEQLAKAFDQQIEELRSLVTQQSSEGLRQPSERRKKLGDGSIGALISHTADNYQRIAEFADGHEQQVAGHVPPRAAGHVPPRAHMPRFMRALGHRPPDHGSEYTADSADPQHIAARLNAARSSLTQIATCSDLQLDTVPADGSFRFCDGKRTLEDVLRALLKHQGRQLDAIRSTAA